MAIYTLSYDLIKRKDYQTLWDALQKQKAHRILESVWLLNTNSSKEEVLAWLRSHVDGDFLTRNFVAYIFECGINSIAAFFNGIIW